MDRVALAQLTLKKVFKYICTANYFNGDKRAFIISKKGLETTFIYQVPILRYPATSPSQPNKAATESNAYGHTCLTDLKRN